jgi:AdoMet-dependent heme synthase
MIVPGRFEQTPFIVIWETTRACALACVHCRAEARPRRDPEELTTDEGLALIDRVAAFGNPPPLLVLTGGDPLRRPDIETLVAYGTRRGLSVSMTPSGTAAVTEARLRALQHAGLARLAVSLDGATPDVHDAFRGVRGSYGWTMKIVERARTLALPLQINTTVCRRTVNDLPVLARRMEDLGVVLWALFFLIPVGRAHADHALAADEIEDVLAWAADLARGATFGIKTTEAPQYHRVLAQRAAGLPTPRRAPDRPDLIGRAGRAVTDGNGFVFVDHVGNICPSGFLPMTAGNVRRDDLVDVYRSAPLFRELRDPSRLGGRCGRCEYRDRCGGSRARAWATTGDALAEDPGCAWQPLASRAEPPRAAIAGGSDATASVSAAAITGALRDVIDPELGMSVVELGLIYGVDVDGGTVSIAMTLTTAGCPLHEVMADWVREAVAKVPGVEHVTVAVTFDPPWTPERIQR